MSDLPKTVELKMDRQLNCEMVTNNSSLIEYLGFNDLLKTASMKALGVPSRLITEGSVSYSSAKVLGSKYAPVELQTLIEQSAFNRASKIQEEDRR